MKKPALLAAAASALLLTVSATPASAQERHERHDRGDRGDRGGRDHDRGGGWNRDGHRGGQWDRRGDHRRGSDAGRVIGSILGGFLLGENYNYRFQYDDNYYRPRGYDRRYYDNWRNRDRGQGCYSVGYRHGCRTIYYSRDFMILNLAGDVYCYRRSYRGWTPAYCPRNWYNY